MSKQKIKMQGMIPSVEIDEPWHLTNCIINNKWIYFMFNEQNIL